MEEIKLYHKVWMALPPLLILLGLSIVAIIPLSQGKGPLFWNCFLLLLSGGFFLWGLSVLIRERVLHKQLRRHPPFRPCLFIQIRRYTHSLHARRGSQEEERGKGHGPHRP